MSKIVSEKCPECPVLSGKVSKMSEIRAQARSCILALKVTSRCTSKERDFGLDAEAPALSDERLPSPPGDHHRGLEAHRASQHLLSGYDVDHNAHLGR